MSQLSMVACPNVDAVGVMRHCSMCAAAVSNFATVRHRSPSRGRIPPELCISFVPPIREGAGNAGCALHPRSRVQDCTKKCAHEHTGSAETLRHSLRNGFTAYALLSPATNSSCHRRCRLEADRSGRIVSATGSLAPATGVGTTRFCRTRIVPFVLRAVTAHEP